MISVDEVKKIARLSCLELSEEETEQYAKEFNTILEHFEVLKTAELGEEVDEQSIQLPGEGREDEVHVENEREEEREKVHQQPLVVSMSLLCW